MREDFREAMRLAPSVHIGDRDFSFVVARESAPFQSVPSLPQLSDSTDTKSTSASATSLWTAMRSSATPRSPSL